MTSLNLSAVLHLVHLVGRPHLCLPHVRVPTFNQLPVPLTREIMSRGRRERTVDIRAVVLDKDNCFAVPHASGVHKAYEDKFAQLKAAYPGPRLLIVSNTAGASACDPTGSLAAEVEAATGIRVLAHRAKKPGCRAEIMAHFCRHPETGVTRPEQIAVVGDRLLTDVMLANLMGSYAIWIQKGVVSSREMGIFARAEQRFAAFLIRRGYHAPEPACLFEENK